MAEPIPYTEAFPVGTVVCIVDRAALEDFKASWKYHHKLSEEQLQFAETVTTVAAVGFYHGGDPLFTLTSLPGLWHEQCLRAGTESHRLHDDGPNERTANNRQATRKGLKRYGLLCAAIATGVLFVSAAMPAHFLWRWVGLPLLILFACAFVPLLYHFGGLLWDWLEGSGGKTILLMNKLAGEPEAAGAILRLALFWMEPTHADVTDQVAYAREQLAKYDIGVDAYPSTRWSPCPTWRTP